ncbi:MAG: hypothetical protein V1644_02730, partial [Candidatus Micrarchaeota archaeon]
ITNSNDLGKVEPGKQDILVEASGFNAKLLMQLLTANALDFAEMGGIIESCVVKYSDGKSVEFPQFNFDNYHVSLKEINSLLGTDLTAKQAIELLDKMMLVSSVQSGKLRVGVPRFRSDVAHNVDVIEDVARAYGFDNFVPLPPSTYTFGKKHCKTILFDAVVNSFVGLGFQQVINLVLTNKDDAIKNTKQKDNGKFVELHSSRALGLNACRQSLFHGLLSIIASNKQYSYPQKIFEAGECLELAEQEETGAKTTWKTAALIAGANAGFEEVKATVEALGRCLDDYKLKVEPIEDSRFIKGRSAKVTGKTFNGVFGEVDLEILNNYNIEMPCTFMEVELNKNG